MAYKVSKESNRSYNSKLEKVKDRLRTIKTIGGKVKILNAKYRAILIVAFCAKKKSDNLEEVGSCNVVPKAF